MTVRELKALALAVYVEKATAWAEFDHRAFWAAIDYVIDMMMRKGVDGGSIEK